MYRLLGENRTFRQSLHQEGVVFLSPNINKPVQISYAEPTHAEKEPLKVV